MELDAKLCSDSLLKDFFNEYLRVQIWPVALYYDEYTGVIFERCPATGAGGGRGGHQRRVDPSLRYSILEWTLQRRWNFFIKSRLYFEYRLCCALNGRRPSDPLELATNPRSSNEPRRVGSGGVANTSGGHDSVISSTLPDELWSDGEEPVAVETCDNDPTQSGREGGRGGGLLSCRQMSRLKAGLTATMGVTMMDLWVQVEAWQVLGDGCGWWAGLRNLRKTYYSLCQCERGVGSRACLSDGDGWMADAQEQCILKLTSYWIPRFNSAITNTPPAHSLQATKGVEPMESRDPSLPFIQGLRYNALCGSPFQEYLTREGLDMAKFQLELWGACDKVLSHQFVSSNQQILRGCWNVWTVLHHQTQGSSHAPNKYGASGAGRGREREKERGRVSGATVFSGSTNNAVKQYHPGATLQHQYAASGLWCALQNTDADSAKVMVEQIEANTLQDLKRLWTKFLREDYESYQQSLNGENDVIDQPGRGEPQRKISRRTIKRRRKKSEAILELEGTPLELLRDQQTLSLFEEYLLSECGDLSEESLTYQLWRAVTSCLAQKNKKKRDTMALKIQQKFIFEDSDHHVDLAGSQLQLLDPNQEVERPDTPTLEAVQAMAGRSLTKVVEQYMMESVELKDSVGSLTSNDNRQKMPNYKLSIGYCVRDEVQHFSETLETNSAGPMSHQLKAFASFLEEHSTLSQRNTLLNNVAFWLEVKKFSNMYLSGTSAQVLLSKGEALIDRYLDTTSPPWVKVTIPAELAVQVVSAVGDLSKVKVRSHIERLHDLLGRCQRTVFVDMLPYWGKFCQQYIPPDGSTISLPPLASCHGHRGSTGTRSSTSLLRLPPLVKRDRTPLLSYSKHKGVQWKFAVPHE